MHCYQRHQVKHEHRIKIGRVRCGLGFYCYTHSEGQHSSLRLFGQYATKTNERHRNVHTKQKRIKDCRKKMYLREQKGI